MTNKEKFVLFLITRGYYDKFCYNLRKQKAQSLEDLLHRRKGIYGIINSLSWHSTEQGAQYWSEANQAWNYILDNGVELTHGCKSIW